MAMEWPVSNVMKLDSTTFDKISGIVYRYAGINLNAGKEELVKSRLAKRMRAMGILGFEEYLDYVENDLSGRELCEMIDALTTNKTSFFREAQHFDYLCKCLLPKLWKTNKEIRIWCAGCSTGEEAYTLAMLLRESMPDNYPADVRILATDISYKVVASARKAEYTEDTLADLPPGILEKYFTPVNASDNAVWRVKDSVRQLVSVARLNLMNEWPVKGPFQIIFCRNVMIYFDKPTQQRLVHRFWELLETGGHLFVGHSESLTAYSKEFRYIMPAIYSK
jgi:chemotaxis protein methyltransferase CheR